MSATTLSGLFRPASPGMARLYDVGIPVAASIVIGLSAQVSIQLPFTPVPVTLQTLAVLLTGAALGSRRGALAVLLVLAEGAAGLPVFSGWRAGLPHLLGPTGGYLVGFVLAAFVTGALAEHGWDRRPLTALAAMAIGNVAVYALGLPILAAFAGSGNVLSLGLYPFVPGDLLKIAAATGLLPLAWKLAHRSSPR
jgi:biotin transport system substrate-specific component